jgi:hypothetical protein
MCDYSLHSVASRPAKVGDKLVSARFRGSETAGFAAVGNPAVAVCQLPGTEVVFESDVEYVRPFGRLWPWLRTAKAGHNVARFRHVNTEMSYPHHDALEFPDGRIVLLTRLQPGQRATVIQMPAGRHSGMSPAASETEPLVA